MQKQHDLADDFLLCLASNDPLRALRADTGHLTQSTRLLLDDIEHGFPKGAHELVRIDRVTVALPLMRHRTRREGRQRGERAFDVVVALLTNSAVAPLQAPVRRAKP